MYYRKAAEQGDPTAQHNLGVMYGNGDGVEQDHVAAAAWFRRAAEQGYVHAQFRLGYVSARGRGVRQDYAEAAKWYLLAARQGHDDAQFGLGTLYAEGRGVPLDLSEATKWYRTSAEQGNPYAQYELGVCCAQGSGVSQDLAEAVEWYRKAAAGGNAPAQFALGLLYERGRGVDQDYAQAAKYFRMASENGHREAMFRLGLLYVRGRGVPEDEFEAELLLLRAVEKKGERPPETSRTATAPNLRLIGQYRYFDEDEPDFSASDAISLALLCHRFRKTGGSAIAEYYGQAYTAVCRGLGLRPIDVAREVNRNASSLGRAEVHVFGHLVRLRSAIVAFSDEWGGYLQGDIWGEHLSDVFLSDVSGRARSWYVGQRCEMARGVEIFDVPLCAMLGWDRDARVSFKELRDDHGFPEYGED